MDRGDLVSDEIVNGIVSERIDQAGLRPGLHPRRLSAHRPAGRRPDRMLAAKGLKLDGVVEITVDEARLRSSVMRIVVYRAKRKPPGQGPRRRQCRSAPKKRLER